MLTQTELYSSGEFTTLWLEHDAQEQPLKIGHRLGLLEDPSKVWIVGRMFMSLNDERHLPPKAKTATILAFLEETGEAELALVYPRISVV